MNKTILFSMCLILVAIIGIGIVSAADADGSTLSDIPTMTVDQSNPDIIQDQSEISIPDSVADDSQGDIIQDDKAVSEDLSGEPVLVDDSTPDIVPADDAAANDTAVDDVAINDTVVDDAAVDDASNASIDNAAVDDAVVDDINIISDGSERIDISNQGKLLAGTPTKVIEDDLSVQMNFTQEQLKQIRKYADYCISVNFDLRKLINKVFADGFIQRWEDLDGFYNAARTICEIHNEAVGMLRQTNYITPRYVFAHMLFYGLDDFFDHL